MKKFGADWKRGTEEPEERDDEEPDVGPRYERSSQKDLRAPNLDGSYKANQADKAAIKKIRDEWKFARKAKPKPAGGWSSQGKGNSAPGGWGSQRPEKDSSKSKEEQGRRGSAGRNSHRESGWERHGSSWGYSRREWSQRSDSAGPRDKGGSQKGHGRRG